ncbi:MAG: VOC family protein [Candidatus Binatia bacterium]
MIQPIALANTHVECRYLRETVPVLTDLLAFEKVAERPGEATLKHPNTNWLLIVHEAGPDAPVKQMHNHYGVRVAAKQEVDAAYEYLTAHKEEYGLKQVGKPAYSHGSYSLYFLEPGTNGWEIECYEDVLRKEIGGIRVGAVRASHWDTPLPPERFPGRGYVPQAFTHGTLACSDLKVSWDFYAKVLGLEVHQANDHVVYVKHPGAKRYVVSAVRKEHKTYSPNFRFTIALESKEAVAEAHRWLAGSGKGLGVTELRELRTDGPAASFLLSDPDKNWWEVSSN